MLDSKIHMERVIAGSFAVVVFAVILSVVFLSAMKAQAQMTAVPDVEQPGTGAAQSDALKWAFVAAAISTGLGCLGAGIAVGFVGSAAIGAVAEKPEFTGKSLIFVGLAEGIAIYGLIIAIMILGRA